MSSESKAEPAPGTARRIALARKIATEGDNPYEVVLTRYAAQMLLGEIDRLKVALIEAESKLKTD